MRRRTFIKAGASTLALAAFSNTTTASGHPSPEDFVQPGVNQIGDGDLNVVSSADPASGRGNVAHATSEGESTTDYVTTVRPLNESLGEFADGSTLTYEYYEGPDNGHAAPDEVWLYIRDGDGEYHVIFHAANDDFSNGDVPDDETWLTRNVHNEITGDPDPEDNPNFTWFELKDDLTREQVGPTNNADNLVDVYGEDAEVLRIGAGVGRTGGGGAVSDVYFRNLEFDGHSRGQFPVNGGRGNGRGR